MLLVNNNNNLYIKLDFAKFSKLHLKNKNTTLFYFTLIYASTIKMLIPLFPLSLFPKNGKPKTSMENLFFFYQLKVSDALCLSAGNEKVAMCLCRALLFLVFRFLAFYFIILYFVIHIITSVQYCCCIMQVKNFMQLLFLQHTLLGGIFRYSKI